MYEIGVLLYEPSDFVNHKTFFCQINYFFLPNKSRFSAILFSLLLCVPFFSISNGESPCAILLESDWRPTRVRLPNYSSPFAVGTRVLLQRISMRTAFPRSKSVIISGSKHFLDSLLLTCKGTKKIKK